MTADGLIPALGAVINAFFLVAGVYIYVSLMRQVAARTPDSEAPPLRMFGWPEALLAAFLAFFFLLSLSGAAAPGVPRMRNKDLIASAALTIGLLRALAGFLRLRRFDLNSLGGFSKIGFFRTAVTGGALILAACPLSFLP